MKTYSTFSHAVIVLFTTVFPLSKILPTSKLFHQQYFKQKTRIQMVIVDEEELDGVKIVGAFG